MKQKLSKKLKKDMDLSDIKIKITKINNFGMIGINKY